MPKSAYQFLLGALLLSFTVMSCNNEGDKKESGGDTTVVAPPMEPTTQPADTTKMDSADTKPVKTLD